MVLQEKRCVNLTVSKTLSNAAIIITSKYQTSCSAAVGEGKRRMGQTEKMFPTAQVKRVI